MAPDVDEALAPARMALVPELELYGRGIASQERFCLLAETAVMAMVEEEELEEAIKVEDGEAVLLLLTACSEHPLLR